MTDYSGAVVQDQLFYPWGLMVGSSQEKRFAKLQHRDSETSLDPTRFRMFSSTQGRWLSPDPAGKRAAKPANPQSWNRYAYVLNNACNAVDPLGLFAPGPCLDPNAPGCGDPFLDPFFLQILFEDRFRGSGPFLFVGGGGGGRGPSLAAAVSKARRAAVDDIRNKPDCAKLFGGAQAADKLAAVKLSGADLGAPDVAGNPDVYKWDYTWARADPRNNLISFNTNSNGFLDPEDLTGYLNGNQKQPVPLYGLDAFNNNPKGPDASKFLGRPATVAEFQTFIMLHEFSHFQGKANSNAFDQDIVTKCLK